MKKFLTLVLALVLALGLAAPAMAFTSDDDAPADVPYTLDIYLVEYDDNDFFGLASLPESDRGYAKNEIVAAVIELFIPKGENPIDDGYTALIVEGDNVRFDVTDNKANDTITTKDTPSFGTWSKDGAKINLTASSIDEEDFDGKVTLKWLIFAKVTDDEASITVKLVEGVASGEFEAGTGSESSLSFLAITLSGDTYVVVKDKAKGAAGTYTISDGENAVIIDVDKNNKSKGMSIYVEDDDVGEFDGIYILGNNDGEVGVYDPSKPATFLATSKSGYKNAMEVYEDIAVDAFGLDYMKKGGYVRDSFFEDLVSGDTIVATVDIEPWTAYVTVPDNIVVDPPKTGDAASILGFAMVALSGAGVVALRKRG